MKRLWILPVVLLAVFLWGCSPFSTEESEEAYNAIEELRDRQITLDDDEYLKELEEQYLSLSEEEQGEITNYDLLEKARTTLREAEDTVDEINAAIRKYEYEFPPEVLNDLSLLAERCEALAPENQNYVDKESLGQLQKQADTWYGEGSLYQQMLQAQKTDDHEAVLSLGVRFMNSSPPPLTRRWYGVVVADSTMALASTYEDDLEKMLGLYTQEHSKLLSQDERSELMSRIIDAYAAYIHPMVEQKKYEDALEEISSLPEQVLQVTKNTSLYQLRGLCYAERAAELLGEKKYEEVSVLCKAALEQKYRLSEEHLGAILQCWIDSNLKLADRYIQAKKYADAYKLLTESEVSELTDAQRSLLQNKQEELFKKCRPKNGTYLVKGAGAGRGYGILEVTNDSSEDAIVSAVKINKEGLDEGTPTLLYITSGNKARFSFADGTYALSYKTGTTYLDTTELFAEEVRWWDVRSADGYTELKTKYYGNSIQYTECKFTID